MLVGLWGSGGILFWRLSICVLKYAPSDALKPRMAFFSTRSANRALISMTRLCSPISVLCDSLLNRALSIPSVSEPLRGSGIVDDDLSGHALW